MADKIKDKKIKGVASTKETTGVEGTEAISQVGEVKATEAVGAVQGTGRVKSARFKTQIMSREERMKLMSMIREEADKMCEDGGLSSSQREIVKSAVIMAVEASMSSDEDEDAATKDRKKGTPGKTPQAKED
jgi:hypothetical protein